MSLWDWSYAQAVTKHGAGSTLLRGALVGAASTTCHPGDEVVLLVPDPNADYAARLPALLRALVGAIDAAGWDCEVSSTGPSRVGDVQREAVEVSAWTPAGRQVRVLFVADAPPGQPRPPFAALTAQLSRGGTVSDASVSDIVAYVRRHPASEHPGGAEPALPRPQTPDGGSRTTARSPRRSSLRLGALRRACAR